MPGVDRAGQAGELGNARVGAVDRPPVERLRGLGPVAGEVDQPQVLGCDPGSGELLVGGVAAVRPASSRVQDFSEW